MPLTEKRNLIKRGNFELSILQQCKILNLNRSSFYYQPAKASPLNLEYAAKRITIVQDNLSAHKPFALYKIYEPDKAREILNRIEFVFTPKHGSWLNMAEIEIGVLKRQGLKKRIASEKELVKQVKQFEQQRNRQFKKVNWQFTTEDARIKLKRLYPIIEEHN